MNYILTIVILLMIKVVSSALNWGYSLLFHLVLNRQTTSTDSGDILLQGRDNHTVGGGVINLVLNKWITASRLNYLKGYQQVGRDIFNPNSGALCEGDELATVGSGIKYQGTNVILLTTRSIYHDSSTINKVVRVTPHSLA